MVDSTDHTACGVFSFRPKWLQGFASLKWFGITLCFIFISSDGFAGYIIGCITTIEKRFKFSSSKSGFLMSIGVIMYTIFVIFITHYGRKNKPRTIAIGMFVSATGMLITALPHFIYGATDESQSPEYSSFTSIAKKSLDVGFFSERDFSSKSSDTCDLTEPPLSETKSPSCNNSDNTVAYILLLTGVALQQIGCTTFYTLGFSYVDDNLANRHDSPWWVGEFKSTYFYLLN